MSTIQEALAREHRSRLERSAREHSLERGVTAARRWRALQHRAERAHRVAQAAGVAC